MHVSEIRVKRIRVNQGTHFDIWHQFQNSTPCPNDMMHTLVTSKENGNFFLAFSEYLNFQSLFQNDYAFRQISYSFQHESECRAESAVDKTHYNDNKVRKRLQSKFEKYIIFDKTYTQSCCFDSSVKSKFGLLQYHTNHGTT